MKQTSRLRVVLRRSRRAAALLISMSMATAILLWTLPFAWWMIFIGNIALIVWAFLAWRRICGAAAITLWADGKVQIEYAGLPSSGNIIEGALTPNCYVGNVLITLVWRENNRKKQILLLSDMMTPEEWRRLRVILRFGDREPEDRKVPQV
ncbi:MAG: hypothetical protein LBS40_06265 [Burkholderiales bacterium]|jgi:hypothetical protein|nr:hypothetical protein [Burkholderiales bacterium]